MRLTSWHECHSPRYGISADLFALTALYTTDSAIHSETASSSPKYALYVLAF
jgi:hypothetical protein